MKLQKTDDFEKQVESGKKIVQKRPEVYSDAVVDSIYKIIRQLYKKNEHSAEELFYCSVYNYWLYGFTIEEIFYLDLLNKTEAEKAAYISHMDRINYMHHLNSKEDEHLLTNKYETYELLKEYYRREIIYINSENDYLVFSDFFNRHEEFVIKPMGMATSIGVRKVKRNDYKNDAETAFHAIIDEIENVKSQYKWAYGSGVIIEEVINQGNELAYLHPESINSIRLTTIRRDNNVCIFYPVLRIGMGREFLCCGAVGSILTGINPYSGITETEGHNEWNEHYSVHPNTNVPIVGIAIPKWNELCEIAKSLALKFDTLHYIGWDFVYTSDGEWIVMEANENGEFLGQIAYQKGLMHEFQSIIQWKSDKEYWWIGKYNN